MNESSRHPRFCPITMIPRKLSFLSTLLALQLCVCFISKSNAQLYAAPTLVEGTWSNKLSNPTFASLALDGWDCTAGFGEASEVPVTNGLDLYLMDVGPSQGAPYPGTDVQDTGLWIKTNSNMTCASKPFTLSGGTRGNYWYHQVAAVANVNDVIDLKCDITLKPTNGESIIIGRYKTRDVSVNFTLALKEGQPDPEELNSYQPVQQFCRQRLDDELAPSYVINTAAGQPFEPEGTENPFDPDAPAKLCPSSDPPWTTAWSDSNKVPDGEYQVVVACKSFNVEDTNPAPPAADASAYDMMLTRLFVGQFEAQEDVIPTVPTTAAVGEQFSVLAAYSASDMYTKPDEQVVLTFSSSDPETVNCEPEVVPVLIGDLSASTVCVGSKPGTFDLTVSFTAMDGQVNVKKGAVQITQVAGLLLAASSDTMSQTETVNITATVLTPTDGQLAGKSVTLFPPDLFSCMPADQLSEAEGKAMFVCSALYEGTGGVFTASYDDSDGTTVVPREDQKVTVSVLPSTDAMVMSEPSPSPAKVNTQVAFTAKVAEGELGLPGKQVTFTLVAGATANFTSATQTTNEQGFASAVVNVTTPGDVTIEGSYISSGGQTYAEQKTVKVEEPTLSLSLSVSPSQVAVGGTFTALASVSYGAVPAAGIVVALELVRGGTDTQCIGASGLTTGGDGQANFTCTVKTINSKETEVRAKITRLDGSETVSPSKVVTAVPGQYTMSLTGGTSLYDLYVIPTGGIFFFSGYPAGYTATLTSSNAAPIAGQKLSVLPMADTPPMTCSPAEVTTGPNGAGSFTCRFDAKILGAGIMKVTLLDPVTRAQTATSVTKPYLIKKMIQYISLTSATTSIKQGVGFELTAQAYSLPSLEDLLAGKTLKLEVVGPGTNALSCLDTVILNIAGRSTVPCSATADATPGDYKLRLRQESDGTTSTQLTISVVVKAETNLTLTPTATNIVAGGQFKINARLTSSDGLFKSIPITYNEAAGITCVPTPTTTSDLGLNTATCTVAANAIAGVATIYANAKTTSGSVQGTTTVTVITDTAVYPSVQCTAATVNLGQYLECKATMTSPTGATFQKNGFNLAFSALPAEGVVCNPRTGITDANGFLSSKCTFNKLEAKKLFAQITPNGKKSDPGFDVAVEPTTHSLTLQSDLTHGKAGTKFKLTVTGAPVPDPAEPKSVGEIHLVYSPTDATNTLISCPVSKSIDQNGAAVFDCEFARVAGVSKEAKKVAISAQHTKDVQLKSNTLTLTIDEEADPGSPVLTLKVDPGTVASSKARVQLTAKLMTQAPSQPMPQKSIQVSISPAKAAVCDKLSAADFVTDNSGTASTYCQFADKVQGTVTFTAKYNATQASAPVTVGAPLKPVKIVGSVSPIKPDLAKEFILTGVLYAGGERTVPGVRMTIDAADAATRQGLTCARGSASVSVPTDTAGVAIRKCTITNSPGSKRFLLRVTEGLSTPLDHEVKFTIGDPAPTGAKLTVDPAAASAAPGVRVNFKLTATTLQDNKPIAGSIIQFTKITPPGPICVANLRTKADGIAEVPCQVPRTAKAGVSYTLEAQVKSCGETAAKVFCPLTAEAKLTVKDFDDIQATLSGPKTVKQGALFALIIDVKDKTGSPMEGAKVALNPDPFAAPNFKCEGLVAAQMVTNKFGKLRLMCSFSGLPADRPQVKTLTATVTGPGPGPQFTTTALTVIRVEQGAAPVRPFSIDVAAAVGTTDRPVQVTVTIMRVDKQPPDAEVGRVFQIKQIGPSTASKCVEPGAASAWPTQQGTNNVGKSTGLCTVTKAGKYQFSAEFTYNGKLYSGISKEVDVKDPTSLTTTLSLDTQVVDGGGPWTAGNARVEKGKAFNMRVKLTNKAGGAAIGNADARLELLKGKGAAITCPGNKLEVDIRTAQDGTVIWQNCKATEAADYNFQATAKVVVDPQTGRYEEPSSPARTVTVVNPTVYNIAAAASPQSTTVGTAFKLTAQATEATTKRPAPNGIQISFYTGAPPVGVTCSGGPLATTDATGKAVKSCTATTAGEKAFDKIYPVVEGLKGTTTIVRVTVVAEQHYTITNVADKASVLVGASFAITASVREVGAAALPKGVAVDFGESQARVSLQCTKNPFDGKTDAAGKVKLTCKALGAGTASFAAIKVLPPGKTDASNTVSVIVKAAPPPKPSPKPPPPPPPKRSPKPKPPKSQMVEIPAPAAPGV